MKKQKSETVLWLLSKEIPQAFEEGWAAWDKQESTGNKITNPYPKNTNEWYSWNKGYNMNGL